MSTEKQLALNLNPTAIAQLPNFRNLVEAAIETLRTLLTSEQLSVHERASLALKILEIDQQQTHSHTSTTNCNSLEQLHLSEAWKQWIVENKLRQVPDHVLVETMVREGIDAIVATQAVRGSLVEKPLPLESEPLQSLHHLAQLSSYFDAVEPNNQISTASNSHVVSQIFQLENFLTAEENSQLLRYALEQEAAFVPTSTATNAIAYRRSLVLHDFPEFSQLIKERVQAVLPRVLEQLNIPAFLITQIEAQLTAHGDGNYYKIHNDNGSSDAATRELTYVYYFCQQPQPFSGGELRIYDSRIEQSRYIKADSFQTVEPRNNSIVFFLSRYMHEVLPTHCPSKAFADSRFTINGWLRR
uniref:2OG-Fe(II) oxygenase n=1 Tax=Trichocoleus desertorum TaxID=1481672 RepID=UPI0025B55E6C|nr:2OG-Fe(II) oxygenase [Trichocoleus desertorum]